MPSSLDLIDETLSHFNEGAKSVRAYTSENTYIITLAQDSNGFWVASENDGFRKEKKKSLEEFYHDVFGIEATY